MFNQSYINDFPERKYIEYLRNPAKLTFIKDNYMLQFSEFLPQRKEFSKIKEQITEIKEQMKKIVEEASNEKNVNKKIKLKKEYDDLNIKCDNLYSKIKSIKNTGCCDDAQGLAFKESLDHYVLKKISEDKSYIESQEFENYWNYISNIVMNRKFETSGGNLYLEFNTNVVFQNSEIRNKIFKKFLSHEQLINNNKLIEYNNKIKVNIINKIKNKSKITQKELDFLGEYIYTSRDFSDDTAKIFAEYMFNEIQNNPSIKTSTQIMGAITSYFTQCYTKDDRVKKSRMFISDYDKNVLMNIAHSSGSGKYCVFEKDLVLKTSLLTKTSLKKSRTFKDNDLYFIMMVAFHELTHEYQKNKANDKVCTSSGISYIIKNVLDNALSKKDKNGIIIEREYNKNHDSTEFEIEADEESWRQCASFLAKHCRTYSYKHGENSSMELEIMCKKNAEEVNARRTFSLKQNKEGKLEPYAIYDVKNMIEIVKQNPNIINNYPMLKTYFNDYGYLKVDTIFKNITDLDGVGLEVNNSGLEFATYMINYGSNTILRTIASGKLNKNQIDNLMINVYNVIHQNIEKVRGLEKVNLNNFNETNHKYDLKNKSNSIFNHYFIECSNQIYFSLQFIYQIRKTYPNIDTKKYFEDFNKYYIGYFGELFKKTKSIDRQELMAICEKYDASNAPELIELSNYLKIQLTNQNNIDHSQIDDVSQGRKPR